MRAAAIETSPSAAWPLRDADPIHVTEDGWGNLMPGSATPDPLAFTGREWDPETGLSYFRARYYDPRLGRFISEDPIGLAGGDISLLGRGGMWIHPDKPHNPPRSSSRGCIMLGRAARERVRASSDDLLYVTDRPPLWPPIVGRREEDHWWSDFFGASFGGQGQ
jgi:RHS repeat-associated protein